MNVLRFMTLGILRISALLNAATLPYTYRLVHESDRLGFYKEFQISRCGLNGWNCRGLPQIPDFTWFLLSQEVGGDPVADMFFVDV